MAGLVVGLISRISDHSDRLSKTPDAGGVSPQDMAGGQDTAKAEADGRTKESQDHSHAQQQFLEQAEQLRGRQEASVGKNIDALHSKQEADQASRERLAQQLAEALAERDAAKNECIREAGTANDIYARTSAWAKAFEAKRAALKSKEEGGGE